MRCIHCGSEIGDTHRFCSVCGGENIPMASVQQQSAAPRQPARSEPVRREPKKGGALKWVLLGIWLVAVIALWIVTLLLTTGSGQQATAQNGEENEAYRETSFVTLTEGEWYRWDSQTDALYCWRFLEDGTAEYVLVGEDTVSTVGYTVAEDSNAVVIGYSDDPAVWEYDPLEGCFWEYRQSGGQTYKTRIFAARGIPAGSAQLYSYRVDNGTAYVSVSFSNVTEMTDAVAEDLIDRYNSYIHFGVCATGMVDSQQEADQAMAAVGPVEIQGIYSTGRVPCCQTLSHMYSHLYHMFSDELIGNLAQWAGNPAEFDGRVYYFVPAMGFPGYYLTGGVTAQGEDRWTAELAMDFDEGNTYLATFAKVDGTIKLISIEDIPESQSSNTQTAAGELTEGEAWTLLQRTDYGWLLHYFAPDGIQDYSDVFVYTPMPDRPDFTVECPSLEGVDTVADLRQMLRRHFTEAYIQQQVLPVSYYCAQRETDVYCGSWFQANGTIYFEPNWGAGDPALFRETMQITQTGTNSWTVTIEREFCTEPETFRIVWEDGTFKRDI